jgi:hypothetical protein
VGGRLPDAVLAAGLAACRVCAVPIGALDGLFEQTVHPRVMQWLARCPGGAWRQLRRIRFVRLARLLLKTFVRAGGDGAVLRRIVVDDAGAPLPPGGCVLAICHTAWGHAVVPWVAARRFAVVLAGPRWAQEAGDVYAPRSTAGLRRILRWLRAGGRAAVAVDSFAARGACEARLFGVPVLVSLVAVRLAAAAGVPLVPTWIAYDRGRLRIHFGQSVDVPRGSIEWALRQMLDCFERWIREDPGEWNDLMPFLRGPVRGGELAARPAVP